MANAIQKRQILTFVLTWTAYASLYFLRKPFGIVKKLPQNAIKSDLRSDLNLSKSELGWLDTAFLFPYATMQMLLAFTGDKFGTRRTFSICLLLSGLSMISFGIWNNIWMFAVLLFLNGTAQAPCWPNSVKALGSWYPDKSLNSVLGIYGTCAFAGGVASTALAVYLQSAYGWRYVYLLPAIIVMTLALFVFCLLCSPSELNVTVPGKETQNMSSHRINCGKLDWFLLWRIPMMPHIAVSLFCLKIVRYSMYMWLPMFLLDYLKYSKVQAGLFSTMFEIGGVVGSAGIGVLIDKCFGRRSLMVTTVAAALSTISLALFYFLSSWGIVANSVFMFSAGMFNCGPDTILGGSVPMELGEADSRHSGSAATGLVNGFGSVGTILQGPIIGALAEQYGWTSVFYFMIALSVFATLSSALASAIQERQRRKQEWKRSLETELSN